MSLVIGSSSKMRHEILREMGVSAFSVLSPDIDERAIRHSDPSIMVQLIAAAKLAKCEQMLLQTPPNAASAPVVVLCADQVIVCGGVVREKPRDAAECAAFLRSYAAGEAAECICTCRALTSQCK